MKNERLHTDEQLKSITLKQIAIDAEKWPRKQVEAFFERQGLEGNDYTGRGRYLGSYTGGYTDCPIICTPETELTLPDALRWEELQKYKPMKEKFGATADPPKQPSYDEIVEQIKKTVNSQLYEENVQLRAKIAQLEAEKETEEEDRRVGFGDEVAFDMHEHGRPAFIGLRYAKYGDDNKVLIAGEGYKWVLEDDYYEGRNAVSLVKTYEK